MFVESRWARSWCACSRLMALTNLKTLRERNTKFSRTTSEFTPLHACTSCPPSRHELNPNENIDYLSSLDEKKRVIWLKKQFSLDLVISRVSFSPKTFFIFQTFVAFHREALARLKGWSIFLFFTGSQNHLIKWKKAWNSWKVVLLLINSPLPHEPDILKLCWFFRPNNCHESLLTSLLQTFYLQYERLERFINCFKLTFFHWTNENNCRVCCGLW